MTSPGLKRIGKEYEELTRNPLEGMRISLADDAELHEWVVIMDGPSNSPYAGGKFTLLLHLPSDYPFKPPTINFKTRIYHPNVSNDEQGSMCLGLLKTDTWKPSSKIATALLATKQLLIEPAPDDSVEPSIADIFKTNKKQFDANAKEAVKKYARK